MKRIHKFFLIILLLFLGGSIAFRLMVGDEFSRGFVSSGAMVTEKNVVGELVSGLSVEQTLRFSGDSVTEIQVLGTNYGKDVKDTLLFSLKDSSGEVLSSAELFTEGLPDGGVWTVPFYPEVSTVGHEDLVLSVSSKWGAHGAAVSLFYGDTLPVGKFEIAAEGLTSAEVNGEALDGTLCYAVGGWSEYELAEWYWPIIALGAALILLIYGITVKQMKEEKSTLILRMIDGFFRYRFLLKQLVSRDFKTKYKRSVLGVFWSFFNPMLTMLVMYLVFSTIFKSSIANFPAYLLCGIVCWNFFNEVTGMCMTSISGNASLITKVYVPKYMYPLSRTVSSMVNLGISLLPLLFVLLITRTPITPRWLLIPYPLMCLFVFALGMGLLLAAMMVFFRDVEFLWGVVSMLWMYLTPIFYTADIIPQQYMGLYKLNPLYHVIRIMRILLIDGVSPEPKAYLLCALLTFIPFVIGAYVFKKTQDRFVLYL